MTKARVFALTCHRRVHFRGFFCNPHRRSNGIYLSMKKNRGLKKEKFGATTTNAPDCSLTAEKSAEKSAVFALSNAVPRPRVRCCDLGGGVLALRVAELVTVCRPLTSLRQPRPFPCVATQFTASAGGALSLSFL